MPTPEGASRLGHSARLEFPFTEHDRSIVRRRIEDDLRSIASEVQRADAHLDALILTGGFSRGEGTVRANRPINDYDLVAIRRRPGRASAYQTLAHSLSTRLGIHVDLTSFWRARLRDVSRRLFWLDTRLGGRVIIGDPLTLDRLPRFGPEKLLPAEIARLLGNRAFGLLEAIPGPGAAGDAGVAELQGAKAALAAMDARLLARNRYAPRMRERLAMSEHERDAPLFRKAVEWKLAEGNAGDPAEWWRQTRDALLRAVESTGARLARDGPPEHAVHFARARRFATSPSRNVRLAIWDLVAMCDYPDGPTDPPRALSVVRRVAPCRTARWRELRSRLTTARARTLQ